MTPKNKLFIGILAFMLIVNILVIFDLNYFYIRAILAFIFLITIPGLLIMLCLKIRNINFWEYLVYTVGLSVAFIMFVGLAVNWTLPFLNITDKPLSLWPILICFDIILLVLWIIAQRRNEDNAHILIFPFEEYKIFPKPKSLFLKTSQIKINNSKKSGNDEQSTKSYSIALNESLSTYQNRQLKLPKRFKFIPKFPSLSWLDRIFIIIPFFFPFMAVIGAFLLNNHGTNIITMIMLGAIAVYVFMVVIFRDKLNENVFPIALYFIGLSLLLMFSMRSWYISGHDIFAENRVFEISHKSFFWSLENYKTSYNACLSLSILPTVFSVFSNQVNPLIFKLFFQITFGAISIISFLFFKLFSKKIFSFLAAVFFLSQGTFFFEMQMESRQEIALLFFGLMLLVLFSKELSPKIRNLFFVIFGFSMIVSHYSTSYIALALFILTYTLTLIYKMYENRKIKKGKLRPEQKEQFYLTGIIILLLLVFGFLWYSQITGTSDDLITTFYQTYTNLPKIFQEDVREQGLTLSSIFGFSYEQKNINSYLVNYTREVASEYQNRSNLKLFDEKNYEGYLPKTMNFQTIPLRLGYSFVSKTYFVFHIMTKLMKLFILLGLISLIFYGIKFKKIKTEYINLCLISTIFIGLIIVLPTLSTKYGTERFAQQILIILSSCCILGMYYSFKLLRIRPAYLLMVTLVILYFLYSSGFVFQIFGGASPDYNLDNFGPPYERFYTHHVEIESISWFSLNRNINLPVYSDLYAKRKIFSFSGNNNIYDDILPQIIDKTSYVFLDYQNKVQKKAYKQYKSTGGGGVYLEYTFPTEFLNDNKNKIYNNGGSEIFK